MARITGDAVYVTPWLDYTITQWANGSYINWTFGGTQKSSRTYGTFSGTLNIDGYTYPINGAWDGAVGGSIQSGSDTWTHTTARTVSVSVTGGIAGTSGWPSTSLSGSITLPSRISAPDAATSVAASRVSDTQVNVSFSASSSSLKPLDNVRLLRSDNGSTSFKQVVGWSAGTVRSFTDTTTVAGRAYVYRVETKNGAGSTQSASSSAVVMTPLAPTVAPVASRNWAGVELALTLPVSPSVWPSQVTHMAVYKSVNGAATALLETVAKAAAYTDASPGAGTLVYSFAGRVGTSGLLGPVSPASNAVTVVSPPNAPLLVSPVGGAGWGRNDGAIPLRMRPQPVDASSCVKVQTRIRAQGSSTWTTQTAVVQSPPVAPGQDVTVSVPLSGVLASNGVYEWSAMSWGAHATGSAWSDPQTFQIAQNPSVVISSPGSSWTQSTLAVAWTYSGSTGQASAQVRLLQAGVLVASGSVNGAATSFAFPSSVRVANGGTYQVQVTCTDGLGIKTTESRTFTVTYLPPRQPALSGEWERDSGVASLTWTTQAGAGGGFAAPVTVGLQRSVNGDDWETIASGLPLSSALDDPTMPLNASVQYRAVAYSADDAMNPSSTVVLSAGIGEADAYLGGGPGFTQVVPLVYNPEVSEKVGLSAQTYHDFEGHTVPVLYEGTGTTRSITYSGSLLETDNLRPTMRQLAETPGLKLFRSPDGNMIFGGLSEVPLKRGRGGTLWDVSFTVTEADAR